jgi:hypothetical protein
MLAYFPRKYFITNPLLKAVAVSALACAMSLLCSCASSSSLVAQWHDSSFKAPPLSKMLIIAIRKDAIRRRVWEEAFAGELEKHGVAAISSSTLFPSEPPDTNQLIETVQSNGFDGIMVILKLPTESSAHYVKGYVSMEPEGAYYGPYWQRYWNTYNAVKHPGYIDTQKVAFSSIDVTSTGNGGRLIWNATSKTPDPDSVTDIQRGIAVLVIRELTHQSIISSKK